MDIRIVREAIVNANKLGRDGKRIIGVDYHYAQDATSNDSVILMLDDGPQTASENW